MFDETIESLCDNPLWVSEFKLYKLFFNNLIKDNLTVYSKHPDFTECFQHTYLIWGPCAILWLVSPIWFYMLTRQKTEMIKISPLHIIKNVVKNKLK